MTLFKHITEHIFLWSKKKKKRIKKPRSENSFVLILILFFTLFWIFYTTYFPTFVLNDISFMFCDDDFIFSVRSFFFLSFFFHFFVISNVLSCSTFTYARRSYFKLTFGYLTYCTVYNWVNNTLIFNQKSYVLRWRCNCHSCK